MRHYRQLILALGMAACWAQGHAQNLNGNRARQALDDFRREVRGELEDFRRKAMDDFISFLRNPWKEFEELPPVPKPKEEPVPPVVIPEEDKDKPVKDKPVVIEEVVTPPPVEPQPQPIEPIRDVPVKEEKTVQFSFFGTQAEVRCDASQCSPLKDLSPESIADAIALLFTDEFDILIADCLHLRDSLCLSDWAYLQMLDEMSQAIVGRGTNGATLLMAYVYLQSGYKMRLGCTDERLYMLYASRHQLFDRGYFLVDGDQYYGLSDIPAKMNISEAAFPKEKGLSLLITKSQQLSRDEKDGRSLASKAFPTVKLASKVNKNLMDFYATYPSSMLDGNVMTCWAMYANTPMDATLKKQIDEQLKPLLKELTPLQAVRRLLDLIQTGLAYEYDDKVWGHDRIFFAEETLFYPYADCEDRAILLTRLVRNLLGLRCILVFYPGHLACAVDFGEDEVKGDYIMLDDHRYVICDPTYIGAPVGVTMPDMDNQTAKVILLD